MIPKPALHCAAFSKGVSDRKYSDLVGRDRQAHRSFAITMWVLIFAERVVAVAVEPALAGLGRRNHRMAGGVRVFAGVLVRRAVAAERNAAFLAGAQMYPVVADLHALRAFAAFRLFD
jgi:hypothetical protein